MKPILARIIACALSLALPLPALARDAKPAPRGAKGEQLQDWPAGPVRYIITRSESRRWKEMQNDAERLNFIRQFWKRRDPDPRTAVNEFRGEYWRRVLEANRRFGSPGKPGWRSDRGKMFILLGEPEQIESREYYDTTGKTGTTAGKGLIRWHYRGLQHAANRAHTIIAFVRDGEDWRLSDDERFSSTGFDMNRPLSEQYPNLGRYADMLDRLPYQHGSLGTAMDLGQLQEVPTEEDLIHGVVTAEDFIGTIPAVLQTHAVAAADGAAVIALTIAIRRDALSPAWDGTAGSLAERFTASATLLAPGAVTPQDVPEDLFVAEPAPAADDAWLRFQALVKLPLGAAAGRWEMSAAVLDRPGGGVAAARAVVDVAPPVDGAPLISGPVLAQTLAHGTDVVPSATRPYRYGEALVVPRTTAEIGAGEPFKLFLEVLAPAGRDLPVALGWEFRRRAPGAAASEPWGKPGHLDDARGTRAWELKPGTLPPGHYDVVFRATCDGCPALERPFAFDVLPAP